MKHCDQTVIECSTVYARNTNVLLAYVVGSDNVPIVPADVADITVNLYELDDAGGRFNVNLAGTELDADLFAAEPVAADVVLEEPTKDGRWTKNSIGFNVVFPIAAPLIGKTYEVRMEITTITGDVLVVAHQLRAV